MSKQVKSENKKRKLPWWAKILIVLLAVVVILVGLSYGMIRYFVGDSLGFKGTLAMVGYGGLDLPEGFRNFVLDVDRSYEGLPDLLTAEDGSAVTNPEEYAKRREEIFDLCETYLYGVVPVDGFETAFTVMEEGDALGGKAHRQQVKITISNELGTADAMLLVFTPKDAESCGMFVGMNFAGNTTVCVDEAILPSIYQSTDAERGSDAGSWPLEQIIDAGYGVATMYYEDWADDDSTTYRDHVLRLFPDEKHTAYSAYAFGIMRGIDYLEQLDYVNMDAIATVGHSRLARVSLWAGANDTRVDLVTASCGGGILRSPLLGRIDSSGATHWSPKDHYAYEGRDSELPADRHMLYALSADRHLYISMGIQDLASDPKGMYDTLQYAKVVWRDIYGMDVIPDIAYEDLEPDVPIFSEGVAVHAHAGGHVITSEDWANYIQYMEEFVLQ